MWKHNEVLTGTFLASWRRPELQARATLSLFDFYFEIHFRPALSLLSMGLCFAASKFLYDQGSRW